MFIGIYYHTLEAKGRLAIPAKFRRKLDKQSVITRGLDGCLFLFPSKQWQQLSEKLSSSPLTKSDARNFVRLMTHEAVKVSFDSQGRTLIPAYLTEFAHLTKEVVIAGTLTRIEIWDKRIYHEYINKLEAEGESLSEGLEELGI